MNSAVLPDILTERCSGCGRCVAACASRCLTLEIRGYRKFARLCSPDRCTGCGNCCRECLLEAIVMIDRSAL